MIDQFIMGMLFGMFSFAVGYWLGHKHAKEKEEAGAYHSTEENN